MARARIAGLLLAACTAGCVAGTPAMTQLQVRELQTRSWPTADTQLVMKAVLNVLQDDGYIVKNANVDLGLLTATKETDVEPTGQAILLAILGGHEARWEKTAVIECSVNVSAFGQETRVRANFQTKTLNNRGEVVTVRTVTDPEFYQSFFSRVDKGIFLQKQQL